MLWLPKQEAPQGRGPVAIPGYSKARKNESNCWVSEQSHTPRKSEFNDYEKYMKLTIIGGNDRSTRPDIYKHLWNNIKVNVLNQGLNEGLNP